MNLPDAIAAALDAELPGQQEPWLLLASDGDVIAYFNIDGSGGIQVDVSGRHFNEDDAVISTLHALQKRVGGVVMDDWDRQVWADD